ncbi:Laccase [Colletotrichum sp. SAR 10_86]|nr:Laccase [Colletotrichum sp. SAR 10_76]KAI8223743.1 Laccase [Colletotrichum sp. SAR 10_86]KAI8226287.1 Laccase [Colletotrichum sp. SAR 10_77]
MRSTLSKGVVFLLYGLAAAAPKSSSGNGVSKRQSSPSVPSGAPNAPAPSAPAASNTPEPVNKSCNAPDSRGCWMDGFDINTAYEDKTPDTGITRQNLQYELVLTEHTSFTGGDGMSKNSAMLINGAFPGPTIEADWGDHVEVRVVNNLRTNGTSIHWHGLRMFNNNVNDGVNGITECPLAPGSSKTYKWKAEQYGSSWYHSHFSDQYANGIVGAIKINGPTSANWDEDLGVYTLTDWYYKGADEIRSSFTAPAAVPASDNILFNGTNVNKNGGGNYSRVTLKPGKTHKISLINMSVDNTFSVQLVDHKMTVVNNDLVPVKPFETDSLYLSVGQRYEVIIKADQDPGAYWFNVSFPSNRLCGTSNMNKPASIFQYEGASTKALPRDAGKAITDAQCQDKTDFEPMYSVDVDQNGFQKTDDDTLDVTVDTSRTTSSQQVYWKVNGQNMDINWDTPTLQYIAQNKTDYPAAYNLFKVPDENKWTYWVIENLFPAPHPMHLHGHDFYILGHSEPASSGRGDGVRFNAQSDTSKLNFKNPTRRDVTQLPGRGWLVVAFKSDNPGAWLFHCHIAWHVSQGLSVQFLERSNDIASVMKISDIDQTCDSWGDYSANAPFQQTDSGLHRDVVLLASLDSIFASSFGLPESQSTTIQQLNAVEQSAPEILGGADEEVVFAEGNIPELFAAVLTLTNSVTDMQLSPAPVLTSWVLRKFPYMKKATAVKDGYIRDRITESVQLIEGGKTEPWSALHSVLLREREVAAKEGRKPDYYKRSIFDEFFGFMMAGHDTSATAMAWGVKYLADNQASQDRLRSALRAALPEAVKEKRTPTYQELIKAQVPYLDAMVEEVLRHAGPIAFVVREALQDTTVLGRHIPKGTNVFLMANGPGYLEPNMPVDDKSRSPGARRAQNKALTGAWADDDISAFRPERWLKYDENAKDESDGAFDPMAGPILAFGLGPRGCFGKRLGLQTLKIEFALIVWHFQLLPLPSELNGYEGIQRFAREPTQCYVRLKNVEM